MKSLMDVIVNALKKQNQERSQMNDMYKIYDSSSIEPEDNYNSEDYNSR